MKASLKTVTSRVGTLAACLALGIATLSQTARSAPNYATAALSDHPVAFWPLTETNSSSSGTLPASDATSNGHNGTYGTTSQNGGNGFLAPQPPTYPGFTNGQGALYCTAGDSNSAVTVPPLNLNTDAVSIVMWINPFAQAGTFTGLFMHRDAAGDASGFGFGGNQQSGAGTMAELGYTWNTNSAATYNFHSGLYPVAGIWQLVALVITSNSATIYLDYVDSGGQFHLESAVNAMPHTTEGFGSGLTLIGDDVLNGNEGDSSRVYSGSISDVAVYNSALTSDQILALFAAGVGVNGFAPSITGQPLSQYVLLGSKVKLSATGVNGTSPIAYQWQLNGTNVNLLADRTNFTGANTNVLTILSATTNDTGSYQLILSNLFGTTYSSNAIVNIQAPALVGQWLDGSTAGTNLLDVSGYSMATNHTAYIVGGGSYLFTNDVPNGKTGYSLLFLNGDTGLIITNSSTADLNYDNTFDDRINSSMTVACWARGWPGSWSPFVSKFGETTPTPAGGWQLRQDGNNNVSPCWTVRGTGGTATLGAAVYGNPEDLAASDLTFGNDGNWHFYVGTYDAGTGIRNLYVDGLLSASENSNSVYELSSDSHLCINAREAHGAISSFSTNEIFDVRIYNYAVTAPQILALYGVNPPVVNGQPKAHQYVLAGSSVQMHASVSGTPPLGLQWQFNGVNINLLADATNFTGANSSTLTILSATPADQGSYRLIATNLYGTAISSNALLTIQARALVGRWLNGSTNLAEVSGYAPAGTFDGTPVGGGVYVFTNDVPAGETGQSLWLYDGASAIQIGNSSTNDASYTNTFDDGIGNNMTVTFWAKGAPGAWSWNPWVSKYGENGQGWQYRTGGAGGPEPCWTVRDNSAGTYTLGAGPTWATTGDQDDLHAVNGPAGGVGDGANRYAVDNNWHFYAGTYNAQTGIRDLFIDGLLCGQETGNTLYNLAPGSHIVIGGRDANGTLGNFSPFEIYDVRIYNYDLTSSQIVAIMPDPVITVQPPASLDAYVGGTARLSATVLTHSTPVTEQWQFNGVNLTNGAHGSATISGANSSTLTISGVTAAWQGVYRLVVSDPAGTVTSTNATVNVLTTAPPPPANLVGAWITGAASLADKSGYSPAGAHDGYAVTGAGTPGLNYAFTNDTPPGMPGVSLYLNNPSSAANTCIAITNSSTLDASYTNTFDDTLTNGMTVMFWAKGTPGIWNPFVSKYGENGQGWQLRRDGASDPCWTLRGTGGAEDMSGAYPFPTDGAWHHYAGTFGGTNFTRNLYVDGVLSAQETGTAPYVLAASSHLAIGGRDGGGNIFGSYFTGEIYGVRIYNTMLSEAQVNSFLTLVTPPAFSTAPVLNGNNFTLNWSSGKLLQATNVLGPWTPTGATSPYTINITTAPRMFFRLSNQ